MKRKRNNDHEQLFLRPKDVTDDPNFLTYIQFHDEYHHNPNYEDEIRKIFNTGSGKKKTEAENIVNGIRKFNEKRSHILQELHEKMEEVPECGLEKLTKDIDHSAKMELSGALEGEFVCNISNQKVTYARQVSIYPDPTEENNPMKMKKVYHVRSDYVPMILSYRMISKFRISIRKYIEKWYLNHDSNQERLFTKEGEVKEKEYIQVLYDRWCDAVKSILLITYDKGSNFFV